MDACTCIANQYVHADLLTDEIIDDNILSIYLALVKFLFPLTCSFLRMKQFVSFYLQFSLKWWLQVQQAQLLCLHAQQYKQSKVVHADFVYSCHSVSSYLQLCNIQFKSIIYLYLIVHSWIILRIWQVPILMLSTYYYFLLYFLTSLSAFNLVSNMNGHTIK